MSTKVSIVGSGIVGQTLANGFVKHGYDVTIETNTASKLEELKSKRNGRATIGSVEDVAKFGEIVVPAVKETAAEAALKAAGIANLTGKTVIDTTNPIADAVKPTMFIGGNHDGAKSEVKAILGQFGFEVADRVSGRRRTRDRAALHPLVHSRFLEQQLEACIQAAKVRRS